MSEPITHWVSFAVNDEYGQTTDGIRAADFGGDWLHIEHTDGRPTGFNPMDAKSMKRGNEVRIGRQVFPILGYCSWLGNMMWEGVKVTREVAQQIAEYLRSTGKYQPDMGAASVFDAWEQGKPILFEEDGEG